MLDPKFKAALDKEIRQDIINEFNEYWDQNYGYVEKIFTDSMIFNYYKQFHTIAKTADMIYDWSLANGDAEVQE